MKESGFTPGSTIAINSELAAPTLRRGEIYPQQTSEYSGSCTGTATSKICKICNDRLIW